MVYAVDTPDFRHRRVPGEGQRTSERHAAPDADLAGLRFDLGGRLPHGMRIRKPVRQRYRLAAEGHDTASAR
jgi:hypothetical protein